MTQMAPKVAPEVIPGSEECAPVSDAERERRERRDQVRAHLRSLGLTISSWARREGYPAKQVYKVLGGETKGLFGASHDIAVKLGIKEGVVGGNDA
jgi:gp16 family phage-associated protein